MKQEGNEIFNALSAKPSPVTLEEVRERLKHISVLCIGLSIDLNHELEQRKRLREEIKRLKAELAYEKSINGGISLKQREKARARARAQYKAELEKKDDL